MYGSWTARLRDTHRARDVANDSIGAVARPCRLDDRRGHVGLAHFLKRSHRELACGRVPGEQHHRRFRHRCGVERGHRIGVTGTAGDERNPDVAGDSRRCIGHVHGGRFVSRVDQLDAFVQRRVEHGHDVIARQREDAPHACARERTNQQVGAPSLHPSIMRGIYRGRGRSGSQRGIIETSTPSRSTA
jgi:hypothetical protein